jgi:hypothetical protein
MPDILAPYQVKFNDQQAWLENTETGSTFYAVDKTVQHMDFLIAKRNEMNSRVGLDALGIF